MTSTPYASRKVRDAAKQASMCDLYRSGLTLQQVGDRYGVSCERVRQVIVAAGVTSRDGGRAPWAKGTAASLYGRQRVNAHKRSIPWLITYPEWMAVWSQSGHLNDRGRGRNRYCMARYHDKGGYEVGNVYITTIAGNVIDYQAELKRRGVECADGWKRLPERKHQTSNTPRWDAPKSGRGGGAIGRGRGWTFVKHATRRPYQVTCGRQYIGSFATQQQAELAYRFACEEAIRKQMA
jgi:hypothetical protein